MMPQVQRFDMPLPVMGVRLGTASAGVKTPGRQDLMLIGIEAGSAVAAVFTRNAFCAAPVVIAREHLQHCSPQWLVTNSGNANAGTGAPGISAAKEVCAALAGLVNCPANAVLPFSTGVIGQRFPAEKITAVLPQAIAKLAEDGWADAARAIMTTDTVPKALSATATCDGQTYTVTGIAKGAGMIKPNMATMLAYIATDAAIERGLLQPLLASIADRTFNRITIDGDTSTNDSCVLVATGRARNAGSLQETHPHWAPVCAALEEVCAGLAREIIRDGEGATKLVKVEVGGGRSVDDCLKAAYAIAESPLVKTALFAGDPNWGRILAAVGRAGITGIDIEQVSLALNDCRILTNGQPVPDYDERVAAEIMARPEYEIRVALGLGDRAASVLTCDFSYDYVRINADYRS